MSSMRFKTGSQREIQAVALNKTGTQCSYQCFPPEFDVCVCVCVCVAGGGEVAGYCVCGGGGGGGGHTLGITQPKQSHCPREFDRRLWHRAAP